MRFSDSPPLFLDQQSCVARNIEFGNSFEGAYGYLISGLAGCQDRACIAPGKRRLQIDPTAEQRRGHCAGIGWFSAQAFDFGLKLCCELTPLLGVVVQYAL